MKPLAIFMFAALICTAQTSTQEKLKGFNGRAVGPALASQLDADRADLASDPSLYSTLSGGDKLESEMAGDWAEMKALSGDIEILAATARASRSSKSTSRPVSAPLRAAAIDVRASILVGLSLTEFRVKVQRLATEIALARDRGISGDTIAPYELAKAWYSLSLWGWSSQIRFADKAPNTSVGGLAIRDRAWMEASEIIDNANIQPPKVDRSLAAEREAQLGRYATDIELVRAKARQDFEDRLAKIKAEAAAEQATEAARHAAAMERLNNSK